MPIVIILILAVLIAQIGFWDTLSAIIGGIAMVILLVLLFAALLGVAAFLAFRRAQTRWRGGRIERP